MAQSVIHQLNEVLSGRVKMQDAPESIQSWARLAIHQGAKEIVQMEWINDRRAAMLKIPPSVRPYVEAEVKRIWSMREAL